MAVASVRWFQGALNQELRGRSGIVGRFIIKQAIQITNEAKIRTSGDPHGYWNGQWYPQAPGGPPGARTGLGHQSIMWRPAEGADVYIGVGRGYMLIVERRKHMAYPWLGPLLKEHGFIVRWFS